MGITPKLISLEPRWQMHKWLGREKFGTVTSKMVASTVYHYIILLIHVDYNSIKLKRVKHQVQERITNVGTNCMLSS